MLPVMGYAVKAPLKRGVAMRTSNNPIEDIVYNMHKASPCWSIVLLV